MKFSKEMEQALHSLSYLEKVEEKVSAREISEGRKIPYEKLSKLLQKLAAAGIIKAERGRQGGYRLNRSLSEITLYDLHHLLEDSEKLVPCLNGKTCQRHMHCTILPGINLFQNDLDQLMARYSVADITGASPFHREEKEKSHG